MRGVFIMFRVYFVSKECVIKGNCGNRPIIITAAFSYDTPIMKKSHKSNDRLTVECLKLCWSFEVSWWSLNRECKLYKAIKKTA